MIHLDLFAGIGGFALASKWMGWHTSAFVEKEPFCQKVLRKNFGDAPLMYDDIFDFTFERYKQDIWNKSLQKEVTPEEANRLCLVDILTGGFP